ncbi:MAG: hypothetical protein D6706_02325, partial [Chloroflexi bacterium]
MRFELMAYLIVFVVAWGTAVFFTPPARHLSFRLGAVAQPGGRRKHQGLMPRLGGIPLILALLLASLVAFWLLPPAANTSDARLLRGVLLGSVVVFIGGVLDDL